MFVDKFVDNRIFPVYNTWLSINFLAIRTPFYDKEATPFLITSGSPPKAAGLFPLWERNGSHDCSKNRKG